MAVGCPLCLPAGPALERARCRDVPPGSVKEIALKHLLALNARKLGTRGFGLVPRSYLIEDNEGCGPEFEYFVKDFKLSQAVAVLLCVVDGPCRDSSRGSADALDAIDKDALREERVPEGLWGRELVDIRWQPGPDPGKHANAEIVAAALSVVRRISSSVSGLEGCLCGAPPVEDEEWCVLRSFSPMQSLDDSVDEAVKAEAASLLSSLPVSFQLPILRSNLWVLKPSCGQFGRGQLLLDRLPEEPAQLLQWAASIGRGGLKAAADLREGCLLQKLIERPHLLDRGLLASIRPPAVPDPDIRSMSGFKYNLRLWALVTLQDPPSVYLYRHGYVSLASKPFEAGPAVLSHITNLRRMESSKKPARGKKNGGVQEVGSMQRHWSAEDLAAYLAHEAGGRDVFADEVLPRIREAVRSVFSALASQPSGLASSEAEAGRRLRRLGLDFLIGSNLEVFLIEANVLRDGFGLGYAASGPTGDLKRGLVEGLTRDEILLKGVLKRGCPEEDPVPDTFERLLPLT